MTFKFADSSTEKYKLICPRQNKETDLSWFMSRLWFKEMKLSRSYVWVYVSSLQFTGREEWRASAAERRASHLLDRRTVDFIYHGRKKEWRINLEISPEIISFKSPKKRKDLEATQLHTDNKAMFVTKT